ncbi:MAG: hypothetical protein DRJ37_04775 [Thermoprotei archaeon]|nr:MAG: hypothetical protein DRJ37_04775 [Thermoprotei archaeon]
MSEVEFERMPGFHRLKHLWKIEYKATAIEPVLTQAASEEAKTEIGDIIGKTYAKPELDAVPLVIENKAVITGNAVKGLFRHLIAAQLTEAGIPVCVQRVKLREDVSPPEGRNEQCPPDNPCFVCTWFGTASRQGALHFSFLESTKPIEDVLVSEPIPIIAISDERMAAVAPRGRGRFALMAPIRRGTEFKGWIKGENLSREIIGAIKEIQDMSERGFVQFGGFKTRGLGSMRIEIMKIEKYKMVPRFELEKTYEGDELASFLKECQEKYHELLSRGGKG